MRALRERIEMMPDSTGVQALKSYLRCSVTLFFVGVCSISASAALTLHVAPNGNDAWSGRNAVPNQARTDGPFATLIGARNAIRELKREEGGLPTGGVIVEVAEGVYEFDDALELNGEDSGAANASTVYRAPPGVEVRLVGGRFISGWKVVADASVLNRLEPAARGKVWQADLKALGIEDYGNVASGGLELFFEDKPARLARWPNEGFVKIRDVTKEAPVTSHGRTGSRTGNFYYEGDRPKRWLGQTDVWLHGYWFWDWSDQYQQVESIDTEQHLVRLAKPYHGYGYLAGARYYALNVLAELDEPGEWQLDRQNGTIYFWPPNTLERGRPMVSAIATLVSLNDASHVRFQGFVMEAVRGTAVKIAGGTDVQIVDCTIRNTGDLAVDIRGGRRNGVVGCDISNTAGSGISLDGGDRATLTKGEHLAESNHIHHYARWKRTYAPAVGISGVGNRVRYNLIHDAPHNAVQLTGNDHVVEFNEFHHVCLETDDVGAFYMGRNWTERGNVVRYNYFHHLGRHGGGVGVMAIYLDDWASGTTAFGNICYKAGRAVLIGGGRDNRVENNVFVDCTPSVHVDARGLGWAKSYFDGSDTTLFDRLAAVDYRRPPWSDRYPELLTLLDDEPVMPKGNVIARNISVGGRWLDLADGLTDETVKLEDNLIDIDPQFVDRSKEDFRLRSTSPAFKLGFESIPVDKIGLHRSKQGASSRTVQPSSSEE